MTTRMTSRDFNQDTARAKKAAEGGPVYITDRGRPAHVLLTFDAYEELIGARRVIDMLGMPAGIEDVGFDVLTSDERPRPASFD
jgi:hypothetical protein